MARGKSQQMTDRQHIELFVRRVDDLRQTRLAKQPFSIGLEVNFSVGGDSSVKLDQPDEDDLRSFLVTFRQFISPKEPVFVQRIYNLCYQIATTSELKDKFAASRARWHNALSSSHFGLQLGLGEKPLSDEEIMDAWINGYYFHNDPELAGLLDSLGTFGRAVAKQTFLLSVVAGSSELGALQSLIRDSLADGSLVV